MMPNVKVETSPSIVVIEEDQQKNRGTPPQRPVDVPVKEISAPSRNNGTDELRKNLQTTTSNQEQAGRKTG